MLSIVSTVRLSRSAYRRKRHNKIVKRLFSRYGVVIAFVLFSTWRTLAQQKNLAAFNLIKLLRRSDEKTKMRNLRIWCFNAKKRRADRKRAAAATEKLHRKGVCREHFEKWKRRFVREATTKMALLHWANRIETQTLARWRRHTEWSARAKLNADGACRGRALRRCFALWLDEFTRMQNERQWAAIRARKQSLVIATQARGAEGAAGGAERASPFVGDHLARDHAAKHILSVL